MEKWDLFDETRQPLNKIHNRKDKMQPGEYHIVVGIWTVNINNEILLTLRHPRKEKYPNFWENSGGCIVEGETSKSGAIRELFEETGIIVNENALFLLGSRKEKTAFVDTYIIRKNLSLSDIKLQEDETVDAQWVTLNKLDEMIESGIISLPVVERLSPLRKALEDFLFANQS